MERILTEKIIEENHKYKIVEITKELIEPSLYGTKLRILNGNVTTVFINKVKVKKKINFN